MSERRAMGGYQLGLATADDDRELREVLSATEMPGKMSLKFLREPSFFYAQAIDGTFRQAVICRDIDSHRIVGFGCRSVREMFVNGHPTPVGYLSLLRILKDYRKRGVLYRLFKYLRQLHQDQRARIYLTTIAEGNETALAQLTSHRAGLPRYHAVGRFQTVAIPIPKRPKLVRSNSGLQVRPALESDRDLIVDFWGRLGLQMQFFPKYVSDDLFSSTGTFLDLSPQDLWLAFRQGVLVGTLGVWNQQAFRQTVVTGYSSTLYWIKPFYNIWANLRGVPGLPQAGTECRYLMGAVPVVDAQQPEILTQLLKNILAQLAGRPFDYLLIGLHESNGLLKYVTPLGVASYGSRLYIVCWEEGEGIRQSLDDRPIYLELGCL